MSKPVISYIEPVVTYSWELRLTERACGTLTVAEGFKKVRLSGLDIQDLNKAIEVLISARDKLNEVNGIK